MLSQWSLFVGAFRYEFFMQMRRRALWITFCIMFCLFAVYFLASDILKEIPQFLDHYPLITLLAGWTLYMNMYFPILIGIFLADRLPRDRHLKVDELLATLPAGLSSRLLGKYLGSLLATTLPFLLFYLLGIGYIAFHAHSLLAFPLALETFMVIVVPGLLFISAFSLACPTVIRIPIPVYQLCFIGYWFWGNTLWFKPQIPSLSRTLFTPIGIYMVKGLYQFPLGDLPATPAQAIASICLLVGIALAVLCVLVRFVKWQQVRQASL